MGVRVDAAGHDVLAAGIDDLGAFGRIEITPDCDDLATVAKYIRAVGPVGVDDRAAF